MSEVMTEPAPAIPAGHRCRIEEVFDQSFIELIGMAPGNPHVRALILKLAGKMPGPDCGTFEQIREWVELNCKKRLRMRPDPASQGAPDDGISIPVEFSDTEYGRAHYSVRRSASDAFCVGAEDLLELVQAAIEDGGGIDQIVNAIAEKVDDDAWDQCDPGMDDSGDYEYSEHDSNDHGDSETSCSKNEIRTRVLAFVRERHPELSGEL
jgi:hypothetical protein